jgi:hypothetical protein
MHDQKPPSHTVAALAVLGQDVARVAAAPLQAHTCDVTGVVAAAVRGRVALAHRWESVDHVAVLWRDVIGRLAEGRVPAAAATLAQLRWAATDLACALLQAWISDHIHQREMGSKEIM